MIFHRSTVAGLLLILGAASSTLAADTPSAAPPAVTAPASPTLSDLSRSLQGYFTEEERDLLFQYMLDSILASFKGEEVFLPPDLSFKLEILLVRMKKEGGHYLDNLIQKLEKDLKRNLEEKLTPPDTSVSPYTPPAPPIYIPSPVPTPVEPKPAPAPTPMPVPPPQQGAWPPGTYAVPAYPVSALQVPSFQMPAYQPPVIQAQPAFQLPAFPFFSLPFFIPNIPSDP